MDQSHAALMRHEPEEKVYGGGTVWHTLRRSVYPRSLDISESSGAVSSRVSLIANTKREAGELRVEGEYRFSEVQVVDMILTVSWQSSCTGKATKAGRS